MWLVFLSTYRMSTVELPPISKAHPSALIQKGQAAAAAATDGVADGFCMPACGDSVVLHTPDQQNIPRQCRQQQLLLLLRRLLLRRRQPRSFYLLRVILMYKSKDLNRDWSPRSKRSFER